MSRLGDARSVEAARDLVWGCVPSCSGTDGEAWFDTRTAQVRACIQICSGCPVRTSCLAGALARAEHFGVWGGVRFKPAWAEAWVVERSTGYSIRGREADGAGLRWQLDTGRAEAEQLARRIVYRGRRRALVARWVRRVGRPMPGGWWIGPWTADDADRRVELMRPVVPAMLRDRAAAGWPWEMRLLAEFPISAIPKKHGPLHAEVAADVEGYGSSVRRAA